MAPSTRAVKTEKPSTPLPEMNSERLCLPKERTLSCLSKTLRSKIWSSSLVNGALGVKSDNEARAWFANHPDVLDQCEELNMEFKVLLESHIQRCSKILEQFKYEELVSKMDDL